MDEMTAKLVALLINGSLLYGLSLWLERRLDQRFEVKSKQ